MGQMKRVEVLRQDGHLNLKFLHHTDFAFCGMALVVMLQVGDLLTVDHINHHPADAYKTLPLGTSPCRWAP